MDYTGIIWRESVPFHRVAVFIQHFLFVCFVLPFFVHGPSNSVKIDSWLNLKMKFSLRLDGGSANSF